MSWNQSLYSRGFDDAHNAISERGRASAWQEYRGLDGSSAVNEYEVGFRTRLNLPDSIVMEG